MQTSDERELKYRLPSAEAFGKVRSRLASDGMPVRQSNRRVIHVRTVHLGG